MSGRIRVRQRPAGSKVAGAPAFAKRFVRSIQGLPQVRQITLEYMGAVPQICTVIEAPRNANEQSDPIYHAEGDLLRAYRELAIDFRVVNRTTNRTRDIGDEPPDGVTILLRR
ncbi:MAG TPA: hypothetical protein VK821_20015 [Dehalococcoidia bacterium]|nr:hypothetical protein [Dehalococcoidia bacterium]